jgi:hypothetical protein
MAGHTSRALCHPGWKTANRDPPRIDEDCPKRRVLMQAPMDIAQFNAMLHSKKDQTQLISSLYKVSTISDSEKLGKVFQAVLWGWF